MSDQQLYLKISSLHSATLKQELADYLDDLLSKQVAEDQKVIRVPIFGCAKGKFRMSDDFNAPIDHFNDYIPQ